MNVEMRDVLTRRADSIDSPRFDPDAVVAQGESLVRLRRRLASSAVAAALVLTVGITALLTRGDGNRPEPTEVPDAVPTWTEGTRPLTWSQDQTLHLGDREVATGLDFISIDLTDDGVALTTLDGRIWFTDGGAPEQIGTTLGVKHVGPASISYHVQRPRNWVASDSAGSMLAWMEFADEPDRPELVVYDTAERVVVARQPLDVADGNAASVVAVAGSAVFVEEDHRRLDPLTPLRRFDLDSGAVSSATPGEVEAERRAVTPALLVDTSSPDGLLVNTPADPTVLELHTTEWIEVEDSRLVGLSDARTGDAVELAVSDWYDGQHLWFTQWLDGDRFAAVSNAGAGELLVCVISAGRCDVVHEEFGMWAPAMTPGHGLRGSEFALGQAMKARAEAAP